MSASAKDSSLDLQEHRLQLEESIGQLQKALQHWQTWDAEYEALKEEVEAVSASKEPEQLRSIRGGFDGELLVLEEINQIFGGENPKPKSQIINTLEHRIEYVTKNVQQLQKQLEAAESKYAAATVITQPDATDEDGQPLTEIIEELDDQDNVLSYRLNKPGDAVPHVQEALKKAGVDDTPSPALKPKPKPKPKATDLQSVRDRQDLEGSGSNSAPQPKEVVSESATVPKKGVSFAEDTKAGQEPATVISRTAKRVQHIMSNAKEQEKIIDQAPIIPDDEDSDDAALRQDMLRYSMGEVGAVVAELQLEEGDSMDDDDGFDYIDDGFDDEDMDDDDDDDDEDRYGRSKGGIVTDKYRQRMLELEQKLGIKSRFTQNLPDQGPDPDTDGAESAGSDDERIGRIVINRNAGSASSAPTPTPKKSSIKSKEQNTADKNKGVRFAHNLDISPEDERAAPVLDEKGDEKDAPEPLGDVVERTAPAQASEPKPPRKASRFKKVRDETGTPEGTPKGPLDAPVHFLDQNRETAPTGPDGMTIADTLVERESVSAPLPPNELDGSMEHSAVADEYHNMRRKFIQRDGGFLKEDESPIQPLDESEGGPERVSRFKAARLSRN